MGVFWIKTRFWLLTALSWIVLDRGLYYSWSRFWRSIVERKYAKRELRKYSSIKELNDAMARWQWRKDPWWQLGDMFSTPQAVEAKGFAGEPVGDCDDFSVYIGSCLKQIFADNGNIVTIDGKKALVGDVSILTVPWMGINGKAGGHNVCIFKYKQGSSNECWAWVSNWYDCKIQLSGLSCLDTLAGFIASRCGARCTRWRRASVDLKKLFERGGNVGKDLW